MNLKGEKQLEPWLIVLLSMTICGLGQYCIGCKRKGLIFFIICLIFFLLDYYMLLSITFTNLFIFIIHNIFFIVFILYVLFDAFESAKKVKSLKFSEQGDETKRYKKDPWLAAFLSFLLIGLGQFYNRQFLKGTVFFLIFVWLNFLDGFFSGMGYFFPVCIGLLMFLFIFEIIVIYDAFKTSSEISSEGLERKGIKYALFLIVVLSLIDSFSYYIFIDDDGIRNRYVVSVYHLWTPWMEPTLKKNERVLVNKYTYLFHKPQKGDIIIYSNEEMENNYLVSRVIATEGEVVEIKKGKVYLDGKLMEEPYVLKGKVFDLRPLKIPEDSFFVLNDDRNFEFDSRIFGTISRKTIKGNVYKVFYPFSKIRSLKRSWGQTLNGRS